MKYRYKTGEALKVLGIPRNRLSQWQGWKFVRADVAAQGSGTKNFYSFENLCQLEFFQRLLEQQFSRTVASQFAFDRKTHDAFKLIKSTHQMSSTIDGVYIKNPMSGESTGKLRRFDNIRNLKIAFFRSGNKIESEYFDPSNFGQVKDELFLSHDVVYIFDLSAIAKKILEKVSKLPQAEA